MKLFFKRLACPIWIGMAPGAIFGYQIDTWQWWAFVAPLMILIDIKGVFHERV